MPPKYSREISCPVVLGDSLKEQFRTSPCEAACPLGNSIQKVQSLIEQGNFETALTYLRAKNPFSAVTGRVCPQFCKTKCNREHLDEGVNIRAVERAAGDWATECRLPARREATHKRIAIVGGGPGGLTAAYYLSLLGHEAMIFEAAPLLGGIPRHAVPDFRLPRDIIDREVGRVLEVGVKARLNTIVGRDIGLAELRQQYDAVILATGMPLDNVLPVKNAEKALKAVEYLRQSALGKRPSTGERVVIMGGGGVAFDCAFTAKRRGAKQVHIICLEKANALRAPAEDREQAEREQVQIHTACTLAGIQADGEVRGVDFFKVRDCHFDASGKLSLEAEPGSETFLACDTVIFAVGTRTDISFLEAENTPQLTARNCIVTDLNQVTTVPKLYAVGDVQSGPASIAAAIGAGRRAAFAVHVQLGGEQARVWILNEQGCLVPQDNRAADTAPHVVEFEEMYGVSGAGATPEKLPAQSQALQPGLGWTEINAGYTAQQAMNEAARCLHCGHCKACGTCVDDCPGYVLALSGDQVKKPEVVFGDECWHCANCRTSCPCGAIAFTFPLRMQV